MEINKKCRFLWRIYLSVAFKTQPFKYKRAPLHNPKKNSVCPLKSTSRMSLKPEYPGLSPLKEADSAPAAELTGRYSRVG